MRRGGMGQDLAAEPVGVARAHDDRPATRSRLHDVVGLVVTVAAAVVVLLPALRPGISLGPFDLLTRFGLTRQPGAPVHNAVQADQIQQFVPWMDLAWHQVHSGHLPLWNPDNVLGTPLAFNWQSGVFSLPALVGYLVPVRYAYAAVVLVKIVVAGTGAYTLCRALGLGPLAATFGGTAFELSGPMIVHDGWPHTAVTCWAPWILVAVMGLVRGRYRFRFTLALAAAVGLAVYGGHPESLIVTGVTVILFVAVYMVARVRAGGDGPVLRPVRDLVVGAACGLGLGAPLLLPGFQLGLASARRYGTGAAAFPLTHVPNLLASGFQGDDFRTAAYVGVVVLALAVVAVRVAWKRPAVPALTVVVVVTALLTFFSPVDKLFDLVPGATTVTWSRAVMLLALALVLLAAVGLDTLARPAGDRVSGERGAGERVVGDGVAGERVVGDGVAGERVALAWAAGTFASLGAVVLGLLVAGHIGLAPSVGRHQASLVWPGVQAVVGTAATWAWWWRVRRPPAHASPTGAAWRAGVPALLLALEAAFLLSAGIPFWSVSSTYFATNPGVTALQRHVGSSLVGYGACRSLRFLTANTSEVGIWPNANIAYGVHEMAVYDPILPDAYFRELKALTGQRTPPSLSQLGMYCASITSVAEARVFGVQYVLDRPTRFGPAGATFVGNVGDEALYSIPGAAQATWTPVPAGGGALPTEAPGTPVAASHPDPASWRVVVDAPAPSMVRFRLTDVPGWNATVNGRPVALAPWAGAMMLEARVPPGHDVIELHYWPAGFATGLDVGAAVLVGLVVTGVGGMAPRSCRRRATPGA